MKEYILSIDPGLNTGIAFVRREPELEVIETKELDFMDTCNYINRILREYGGENVDCVVERFTITAQTAKNSQAPWSLELIGVFRYFAAAFGAGDLTFQLPSQAKSFCPNPVLKALGLWHKGGGGHALDALRHVVVRLVDTGWQDRRILDARSGLHS